MRRPSAWKQEMAIIQSDIHRERDEIAKSLPSLEPLNDAGIARRKEIQIKLITRYENEVIPRMKKESRNYLIVHIIYYCFLAVSAILSFLNIVDIVAIVGSIGLTSLGAAIDLQGIYNRIIQTIQHRPILDKSVTFLKNKLDEVDTEKEIDDLEDTMSFLTRMSLYNYVDFIKVLDLLKTIYPLENKAVDTMPV